MNSPFKFLSAIILVSLAIILSGCDSYLIHDQATQNEKIILDNKKNISQTLTSMSYGLKGFNLSFSPVTDGDGFITIDILQQANGQTIRSASMPIRAITDEKNYSFQFEPIIQSNLTDFIVKISVIGEGSVQVGYSSDAKYMEGGLHLNNVPIDSQLFFSTSYDPLIANLTWITFIFQTGFFLILSGLVFILPGWSLLQLAWKEWKSLAFFVKLGLSLGISFALYPLLLLWLDVLGVQPGPFLVWITLGISLILLGFSIYRNKWNDQIQGKKPLNFQLKNLDPIDLITLLVVFLIILSRFWAIRTLPAPLWGDSISHANISQLFVDHNGMFSEWFPYTPYVSFTLQYGFSLLSSLWIWFTGASILNSSLIVGQLVNIAAILTIYPLVMKITSNNKVTAALALVLSGLLSPLPGGYVNWGRYAQLAGLAILPVALWLLWSGLEEKKNLTGMPKQASFYAVPVILTGLAFSGMTLSYYRMFFYFISFLAIYLLILSLPAWKNNSKKFIIDSLFLIASGALSIILVLPWVLKIQGGTLTSQVSNSVVAPTHTFEMVFHDYLTWKNILDYYPFGLLILLGVGFMISLFQKNKPIILISLWYILLSGIFLTQLIRIPAAVFLQNFSVMISLYIPIAIVGSWTIEKIYSSSTISDSSLKWMRIVYSALLTIALIYGTTRQSQISDPKFYAMLTRPDIRAIQWINQNLSSSTYFMQEGLRVPPGDSIVGTDGGWWLGLLTGRKNTMPPQYALLNETPKDKSYNEMIVHLVAILEEKPIDDPEVLKILCKEKITHAYIGQQEGKVSFGNTPIFTKDELMKSSAFFPIYLQDHVSIFELIPSNCQ